MYPILRGFMYWVGHAIQLVLLSDCDFSSGQRFVGAYLYTFITIPELFVIFCRFNAVVIKSLTPDIAI